MVPFGVLGITRHLLFRDPKKNHNFDSLPYRMHTKKPDRSSLTETKLRAV